MSIECTSPLSFASPQIAETTRFNLGLQQLLSERDLVFADAASGVVDLLNAFADGFNSTSGIDGSNSSGYSASEPGVIIPRPTPSTWGTAYTPTGLTSTVASQAGINRRQAFAASLLADFTADFVRFSFKAPGTGTFAISECYCGIQGTTTNFASAPTQVLFGGNSGLTINAGSADVVSDPVLFPYTGTSPLMLAWYTTGANTIYNSTGPAGCTFYFKTGVGSSEASMTTVTGYTGGPGCLQISLIEATTATTPGNLDLRSISRSINDTPKLVDVFAFVEETDALTLNTDLLLYASRNGNTNYVQGTAVKIGSLANGITFVGALGIDVTSQGSAKNLRWRVTSANGKKFKLRSVAAYGRN